MLKQKIQDDLKQAMLSRDEIKTSTLRMLKSAVGYFEIQKGGAGYEATEEDIQQVLQKEVKQRRDSIEQFTSGGRTELAEKEKKELQILKEYLPEQLSEEEVRKIVEQAIQQSGAKTMQEMGKVMGVLMPQIKGKADGNLVSKIVRENLQ